RRPAGEAAVPTAGRRPRAAAYERPPRIDTMGLSWKEISDVRRKTFRATPGTLESYRYSVPKTPSTSRRPRETWRPPPTVPIVSVLRTPPSDAAAIGYRFSA